jgi:RNase P subunit RPR2
MLNALRHLFGCTHRNTTFPLTPHHKLGSSMADNAFDGTYVVCLDCGKEFRYDWQEMRLGDPILARCANAGR